MDSTLQPLPPSDPFATTQPDSLAEPATPPEPPSPSRRVFIGPYGLRAGWSLLIYIALLLSIVFTVRGIHEHNKAKAHQAAVAAAQASGTPIKETKRDSNAPLLVLDATMQEGISFAVIFALSLVMALIERRRFTVYGLGGQRSLSRFFTGAVWGLAALSLLVGTLRVLHLVSFDAQLDHGWPILGWGVAQLAGFLFVGLVEEYLFRGYFQFTLSRGLVSLGNLTSRPHARAIGFWLATLITSAIFVLAHTTNAGEDKLGLFQVFLAGVVFVVALWRTGSLWWAIGFHTTWDWAQSFLYGVPDSGLLVQGRLFATHPSGNPLLSGGTAGPEGSVLCIPILLLVILVLCFTRPSPQPPLEVEFATEPIEPEPNGGFVSSEIAT
jgi:membrane protease YdiL (CAAX protease family)